MNGLWQQFGVSLRLYFRNKMGMFYGYLFPAIFLLAFLVLYRNEAVPLARHMGQLLTVTILGGACLGMPTTMVSEKLMEALKRLDKVAYIRFASVYRSFDDIGHFEAELAKLGSH